MTIEEFRLKKTKKPPKKDAKRKATLIKLENQKTILCGPEVANLMIEFARTFNAQIYKIEIEQNPEIKLMDLDETISFICEGKTYKDLPPHKITTIMLNSEETYPKELKNTIASCLAEKRIVKVDYLVTKFPKINIELIKNYLKELSERIKNDGIVQVEFDENSLKVI